LGLHQEKLYVAALFAYFDESGKFHDHSVVSVCGFVDTAEHWTHFSLDWKYWLRRSGLACLHAKKALRHSQPLSKKLPAFEPIPRSNAIAPFIRTIKQNLVFGVGVAVHVAAFQAAPSRMTEAFSGDPQYLAFTKAIYITLDHFPDEKTSVALICDDDQEKALSVYRLLMRMKSADPKIKKRIPSICFGDDCEYPSLQAADLFSYLLRLEAERTFHGKQNPYAALDAEMRIREEGQRITVKGGLWGTEEFAD
jgi:Protein of unknown function (DUF3800)